MTVESRQHAIWKRLLDGRLDGWSVKVGILTPNERPEPGGPTIGEIARWNHDGTGDTPARPFLSRPLDGRTAEVKTMMARISKALLAGKPAEPILKAAGEWSRNRVIAAINARAYAPNAESTKRQKGSDLPLVDTGLLKSAIQVEVKNG